MESHAIPFSSAQVWNHSAMWQIYCVVLCNKIFWEKVHIHVTFTIIHCYILLLIVVPNLEIKLFYRHASIEKSKRSTYRVDTICCFMHSQGLKTCEANAWTWNLCPTYIRRDHCICSKHVCGEYMFFLQSRCWADWFLSWTDQNLHMLLNSAFTLTNNPQSLKTYIKRQLGNTVLKCLL